MKYHIINGNLNRFHYYQISKFRFFKSALLLLDQFWANILYVWEFFWAESLQKTCLYVHEKLQRNFSVRICKKKFHFSTLWIWLFGISDKRPQVCNEVKNSIGFLHGPRLMARTTKSPIRGNLWVPLSFRAHLGTVNIWKRDGEICNSSRLHISSNMLLQYKSLIKESQDYGVKKANERAIWSFLVRKWCWSPIQSVVIPIYCFLLFY